MSRDPQDAKNVFGKPVTDKGSRSQNADYAEQYDKEDDKYNQAIDYVKNEKAKYGGELSTRCIFYNATGETLNTGSLDHSYDGKIYDSYPLEVKNGQWGAFLHVGDGYLASKAYVVYLVKTNKDPDLGKTLIGWKTPINVSPPDIDTHAFCAVHDYAYDINNDEISEDIDRASKSTTSTFEGISMTADTDSTNSPLLVVRFLLRNA